MRAALAILGGALLLGTPARAEPIHGRVQLQDIVSLDRSNSLAARLDARSRNDVLGDLRLSWSPRRGAWSFDVGYRAGFDAGDTPQLDRELETLGLFPAASPASALDLTDRFIDARRLTATQRIDRLSIGYASGPWVVRAGRQALSWGAGLVFRPMDLLDPFAPDATDTEYKPGTDMLYGQYLFDDGSDLQGVIVPRPARHGGPLTGNASSFALLGRTALGTLQATALLARDHGDVVAGLGLNGPLGGASWNVEIVPTFLREGGTAVSALANISSAGTLWNRDISYFGEYFHNGFGISHRHAALTDLSPALVDRLQRGQLFDSGRDYVALGAQLQWTPLLQIAPTLIANMGDGSLYALGEVRWSLSDNATLNLGGQLPIGPAGTEFGGLALTPDMPTTFGVPARLYAQLRFYF